MLLSIFLWNLWFQFAVNNVNIAALYHCKPFDVATILVSSVLFVGLLYFYIQIIEYFILGSSYVW